ncbi:MAG: hypothetical protein HYW47_00695 [Deltaproteobacteria bacterium]|nr:hypothetical protein [Deltaproteobacteria bacterium]
MKKIFLLSLIIFGLSAIGCGKLNEGAQQIPYAEFKQVPGGTNFPEGHTVSFGKINVQNFRALEQIFGQGVSPQDVVAKLTYKTDGQNIETSSHSEVILLAKKNGKLYFYKFQDASGSANQNHIDVTYRDNQGTLSFVGNVDASGRINSDVRLDCHVQKTCSVIGTFESHVNDVDSKIN